ncbi:MAG: response regulator [Lachnospiraceae bacterium]|nr:response regulator [Lachnospiraceae bacterium]
MSGSDKNEIGALSHIVIITAIMLFSIVLILITVNQGEDMWLIPLFAVAGATCFFIHVTEALSPRLRLYIYSVVLNIELFYYTVNTENLYDVMPVVMLLLLLFAMTRERRFVWGCIVTAFFGTAFRVILNAVTGVSDIDIYVILHIAWHLLMVVAVGIVINKILTESKKSQEYYKTQIDALEQDNKRADDFLANVSHEIRTPINAVIGLTDVCLDMEKDEKMRDNLQAVSEAGKRVEEQISDILDYAEIGMNKLVVYNEDYGLSSVLNDLVEEIRPYKSKDIELVIDIDPHIPLVLIGDAVKLKRILWHVTMNGLKYTKEGGVYVCISYMPQEYGINLCIDVKDTGVGMTEEELERIYEKFYQSDSGRTRSSNGLGLGMSIVSGLVSALEGFITVNSRPGEGTDVHICIPQKVAVAIPCMSVNDREKRNIGTFLRFERFSNPNVREYYKSMMMNTITGLNIPVQRINNTEELKRINNITQMTHLFVGETEYMSDITYMEQLAEELTLVVVCDDDFEPVRGSKSRILRKPFYAFTIMSILNSGQENDSFSKGRLYCRGVKALTVDDEPMNLKVAKNLFRRYGMEVSLASSGSEAIELCDKTNYDIIFMDYMMPQMDGIEAAKRIRSVSARKGYQPVIVALTANAMSTAREMFMKEGFDGFISKPVEISELERILKKVLPNSFITYMDEEGIEYLAEDGQFGEVINNSPTDELKAAGIDIDTGLGYCLNDMDLYKEVLLEFANDSTEKKEELEKFYKSNDWENFTIRIHALKSSARMIGALSISDRAKTLEEASKESDAVFIRTNYPKFIPDYLKLTEIIRHIYGAGDTYAE